MFFEGTLQEGIANAVQQAKMVVCFVADDKEESTKWEKDYLLDDSIKTAMSTQAVALRLQAGSEEAKYLAAIFPLPKTPTLVLIRNGELKEYIAAGVGRDDFIARIQKALGVAQPTATAQPEPTTPEPLQAQYAAGHRSAVGRPETTPQNGGTSSSVQANTATSSSRDGSSGRVPQRQPQPTGFAAPNGPDKGKGKAQPVANDPPTGKAQAEVAKAAELIKKRKQEATEERRRILEQIEHDKADRKAREEERKAIQEGTAVDKQTTSSLPKTTMSKSRSETCALQVRDFDGSTIRTRLPSSGTLRKDVREWVDANRGPAGSGPYLFKLVLTPQPNRTIGETEEDKTLLDLELAPSSTLILVPVPRFSSAYGAGGGGHGQGRGGLLGPLNALLVAIMSIINGFLGMLGRLLSGPALVGQGDAGLEMDEREQSPAQRAQGTSTGHQSPTGASRNRPENSRVTGFRNPNDNQRDQQLYNGNSLNFEPRPDDE